MILNAVNELMALLTAVPSSVHDQEWRDKADIICGFARTVSERVLREVGMDPEDEHHMWNCLVACFGLEEDELAVLKELCLADLIGNSKGETLHFYFVRSDLATPEVDSRIEFQFLFCRGRVIHWDCKKQKILRVMSYEEAAQFTVFWLAEKILQIIRKNEWHRVRPVAELWDKLSVFIVNIQAL